MENLQIHGISLHAYWLSLFSLKNNLILRDPFLIPFFFPTTKYWSTPQAAHYLNPSPTQPMIDPRLFL